MKRLRELRQRRNELITQSRTLLDKADTEKRGLSADEQTQYDKLWKDQDELRAEIEREERQLQVERELAESEMRNGGGNGGGNGAGNGGENRSGGPRSTPEFRDAFHALLVNGRNALTAEQMRALAMDNGTQGGFMVASEQFVDRMIQAVDDEVFVRRYATVERVDRAASLGVPTLDADPADADWTSEIQTGSEDSQMSIGKREFVPSPLAKRIKVSNKLISRVGQRAGDLVAQRLGYKFGIAQEKAFFLGSGANQPLGVFTAHSSGIPTGRDFSNGNTATAITMNGLISAKYGLKSQHQKKARWGFHRNAIEQIAKLTDSQGGYLWQPSKKEGEPDMLLGLPVDMSEYIPNTFTTGKYVGILANWKDGYWIADAMDFQIQVLKELYAETNQTGYIGRMETDGAPVLAEAFARVKLG